MGSHYTISMTSSLEHHDVTVFVMGLASLKQNVDLQRTRQLQPDTYVNYSSSDPILDEHITPPDDSVSGEHTTPSSDSILGEHLSVSTSVLGEITPSSSQPELGTNGSGRMSTNLADITPSSDSVLGKHLSVNTTVLGGHTPSP